jgi:tetratricopeptide (TPR) repeat protein
MEAIMEKKAKDPPEDQCALGHRIVICENKSMCLIDTEAAALCDYCESKIEVTEQHWHCNVCLDGLLCFQCGATPAHESLQIKTKQEMDDYLLSQFKKVAPLVAQAQAHYNEKRWKEAEDIVTCLINMAFNSNHLASFFFFFRAKVCAEQGKKLQSLSDICRGKHLEKLRKQDGVDHNIASPNFNDVVLHCKVAIKLSTVEKCSSPLQAAKEAYLAKDFDMACKYFRRSKIVCPNQRLTGNYRDAFLICLSALSYNAEALLELEELPEKELATADIAHLYAWKSKLYWECAMDTEALLNAQKSISLKGTEQAYISLGKCYYTLGHLKKSLEAFILAYVHNPYSWVAAMECYAVSKMIPEEKETQSRTWLIIATNLRPGINVIEFVQNRSWKELFAVSKQEILNLPTQLFTT